MEAVILCGIPGSGKSRFYRERFFDTHLRINLDMLRTRGREQHLLAACLAGRQRFVIDNTNVTAAERRQYVEAARAAGFRAIAYWLDVAPTQAIARNQQRAGRAQVRAGAIVDTHKRMQPPRRAEGFDEVHRVTVDGQGQFQVEPDAGPSDDGSPGPMAGSPLT
jgi:predicted kinase